MKQERKSHVLQGCLHTSISQSIFHTLTKNQSATLAVSVLIRERYVSICYNRVKLLT